MALRRSFVASCHSAKVFKRFVTLETLAARSIQSYTSRSSDPHLNLSIEHFLLQRSAPESIILLFYVNRPCVVIGRNQNPWTEVNFDLVRNTRRDSQNTDEQRIGNDSLVSSLPPVDLVRRRSGGGTVFHDSGNVNWTVICPSSTFTRDKHAEMVVRALRRLGLSRSRVNERHDIVFDQGTLGHGPMWTADDDTHFTPYQKLNPAVRGALKVSGSAYKLTRGRALHHATALLDSPNLHVIPQYLSSPARQFIKGRGVDSVSSPVGNIKLCNHDFINAVQKEFESMYDARHITPVELDETALENEDIRTGYEELKSAEWTYLQTPQFTICNLPGLSAEKRKESERPYVSLDVRNGRIVDFDVRVSHDKDAMVKASFERLKGLAVHEITDWHGLLGTVELGCAEATALVTWLEKMLAVNHRT